MGRVEWIGLRPEKGAPMNVVDQAQADIELGLVGDRHAGGPGHRRQVTLFQMEHLDVIASLLGADKVQPEMTRRNLGVSGLNLMSLEDREFKIGDVILRFTAPCPPCQRMNQTLGPGGLTAMIGHGGIMACIVQGGTIRTGDEVSPREGAAGG